MIYQGDFETNRPTHGILRQPNGGECFKMSYDTKCVTIHQHPQPVTRVKVASASPARPPANPLKENMEERGDRHGGGAMSEGMCVEVTKGRGGLSQATQVQVVFAKLDKNFSFFPAVMDRGGFKHVRSICNRVQQICKRDLFVCKRKMFQTSEI